MATVPTKTVGISTKLGSAGFTIASLNVIYWGLFETTWWPTVSAPPPTMWQNVILVVTGVVGYYVPEMADRTREEPK